MVPAMVTRCGCHHWVPLFTGHKTIKTPFAKTNPMEGLRQVSTGMFSRSVSRTTVTHLECAETSSAVGWSGIGTQTGTHHQYALANAYRQQVRTGSSHDKFALLDRNHQGANLAVCLLSKAMVASHCFHCGFHGITVFFTDQTQVCETTPWIRCEGRESDVE